MNRITNSPNFTANYVKSVTVLKKDVPVKVALLEVTKKDLFNVERVSEKWGTNISELIAKSMYFPLPGAKRTNIYAISTQTEKYEKMNPSKVLSLFEVTDRGDCYALEYLDVNPKYKHKPDSLKPTRTEFSKIGKASLDFIRGMYKSKEVEIIPVKESVKFYEKMGCKNAPKDNLEKRMVL